MDGYCERVEAGLWAEPLNAVSNLAFLVAAIAVWLVAREPRTRALAVLIGLIFLGSTAFHTTATVWGRGGGHRVHPGVPAVLRRPVRARLRRCAMADGVARGAHVGVFTALVALGAGAVEFAVSLTFRTLDEPLCAALPVGTYYAWHVLDAVTLYLVSLAAVRR